MIDENGAGAPPLKELPFGTRVWLAFVCFLRVLFNGIFAAEVFRIHTSPVLPLPSREPKALPEKKEPARPAEPDKEPASAKKKVEPERPAKPVAAPLPAEPDPAPALQLLALLQREGRLVDFLEQDIASFGDAEIGAAVRVVHEGCRKALRDHVRLAPVCDEEEGQTITLASGFDAASIKLTGDVRGSGPYKGVLRHRGWRATEVKLPRAVAGHDARTIAPAEVEI